MARRMPDWPAVAVAAGVAAVALAGCTDPGPGQDPLPALRWPVLDVDTNASEPWEYRGFIRVAWRDGLFGIDSETEFDLPRHMIRSDDAVYETVQGIGWTRWTLEQAEGGAISPRYVAWDLPRLLDHPDLRRSVAADGAQTRVSVEGSIDHDGRSRDVDLTVVARGGRVTEADLAAAWARESPFGFAPADEPLGFELRVPASSLTQREVLDGDGKAHGAHLTVIRLLERRADTPGRDMPERLDPESMRVELTLAGKEWPENAFTGAPLADTGRSGDFTWIRCGPDDAEYVGLGWDKAVLGQTFGKGCPAGG